jgi:hypothetical protein
MTWMLIEKPIDISTNVTFQERSKDLSKMFGIYSIFEYNGEDLIEENTQKSQIINKEYWKRY